MWQFLVDEDMPRSTARVLRQADYAAEDVRDVGLRGHNDQDVYDYAQAHEATLVTADKGFSYELRFPPGTHTGIIVIRVPNQWSTSQVNRVLVGALASLHGEELRGLLVIVEASRIRIRRPAHTTLADNQLLHARNN